MVRGREANFCLAEEKGAEGERGGDGEFAGQQDYDSQTGSFRRRLRPAGSRVGAASPPGSGQRSSHQVADRGQNCRGH